MRRTLEVRCTEVRCTPHMEVRCMSNSSRKVNKYFDIKAWIISRLKKENSVALTILAEEYARQRNISKRSARRILERRLKLLIENGIVERLSTYPVSFKLKKLPLEYLLPSNKNFRICDRFDLSLSNHICDTLGNSANQKQKLQELRKNEIRGIKRANRFRQRALLSAQKASISPQTRQHSDITFLFEENVKEWNRSVIVFANENGEFLVSRVKTRFNNKNKALRNLIKSKKALKVAFKRHENAIMITLTIPHIFPLVLPLREGDKIVAFIPLQDSIIMQLKASMMKWIRKTWKDRKIEMFTAYEYHTDYALHIHIIVLGIPYLIDWKRKFGRKKEDALTYYSKKYDIPLPSDAKKSQLSKYIFTALLDKWLQKILVRFSSILHVELLQAYLEYKRKEKLQGPINEIHRIKNGKWKGKPPKDALLEYSSGAAYRKVLSPDRYVTKYVLKVFEMIQGGGNIDEENQAKVYGYWLFGKRFNSYSRSLLPQKREQQRKMNHWYYVGVFNKLNLPEFIVKNIILELS